MPLKADAKVMAQLSRLRGILGHDSTIVSDASNLASHVSKDSKIKSLVVHNDEQNAEALKGIIADRGIGTFLDVPVNMVRSLPPVRKAIPDEKYNNFLYGYQKKLIDADRKSGEYLAGKGKFLKKLFTTTDLLPSGSAVTEDGKVVRAYVPTEVSRLSAPFDKSKEFVIPTLALYGVSSVVDSDKKTQSSGGEGGAKMASEFSALKSQLVEKIASTVQTIEVNKFLQKEAALISTANRASEMLKCASVKIGELETEMSKLAEEVQTLQGELDQRDNYDKSVKLAKQMLSKRMIKQADYDSQVEYISKLSSDNYSILAKTVEEMPLNKNYAGQNGLDKLSYMYMEQDDRQGAQEKPSLEDAILNFGK